MLKTCKVGRRDEALGRYTRIHYVEMTMCLCNNTSSHCSETSNGLHGTHNASYEYNGRGFRLQNIPTVHKSHQVTSVLSNNMASQAEYASLQRGTVTPRLLIRAHDLPASRTHFIHSSSFILSNPVRTISQISFEVEAPNSLLSIAVR